MNAFELFAVLKLNSDSFQQGLQASEKQAEGFSSGLKGKVSGAAKAATAALAGMAAATGAVVKGVSSQINKTAQYGDEVDKMSQKLGLSSDAYQKWGYAMKLAGTDINSMGAGIKTLTNKIDDAKNGSADAKAMFEKLGISMEDLGKMSREEVFEAAIYGFQGMADSTERAALANDVFGKSGQNLAPLFNQTKEATQEQIAAAEKYGMVMSEDAVKASAAFEDSLTTLKDTLTGLRNGEFAKFLPGVTSIMNGLTEIFSGNDQAKGIGLIKTGLNDFMSNLSSTLPKVVEIGKDIVLSLANAIIENLPSVMESGVNTIMDFISGVVKMLPKVISAGVQIIVSFIKGIGKALPKLIPEAVKAVTSIIKEIVNHIPDLIEAVVELFTGFVEGIQKAIPVIIEALPELITGIVNGILKGIPTLIQGFIDLFKSFVQSVPDIITEIVEAIPQIITGIVNGLLDNIGDIVSAFIDLFASFVQAVPDIITGIVDAIPQIIGGIVKGLLQGVGEISRAFVELFSGSDEAAASASAALEAHLVSLANFNQALQEINPQLVDYNALVSEQGHTISELDSTISEAENSITEIIRTAVQEQGELRQEDLDNIQTYMEEMQRLEEEKLSIYKSQQISELTKIQQDIASLDVEGAQQRLVNAQAYHDSSLEIADIAYSNEISHIEAKYQAIGGIGSTAYQTELQAASDHYTEQKNTIDGILTETAAVVAGKSNEWIMKDAETWAALSQNMSAWDAKTGSSFYNWIMNANGWLGNLDGVKTSYIETLSTMDLETASAFLRMQVETQKANGTISEESKSIAKNILGAFDNLPDELDTAGKNALLGMIAGFKDQIPGLEEASSMSANEIVDTISEELNMHSPSVVLDNLGQNAIQGMINGILKKQGEVETSSSQITSSVNNVMEKNNPKMDAAGVGFIKNMMAGFEKKQDSFIQLNQNLMSTMETTLSNGSDKLVDAIKQIFTNAHTVMKTAGGYMAQGVAAGFVAEEKNITQEMNNMMARITQSIKSKMKIQSPSKVFAEIGGYLAEGLAVGISDEAKVAISEAMAMADGVQDAMSGLYSQTGEIKTSVAVTRSEADIKREQKMDIIIATLEEIIRSIDRPIYLDGEKISENMIGRLTTTISREVSAYV